MARFALTIFLSAFLLFQVQPMIAKHALPWFGGGPAVWTTCMLFFQALLLGGYLYAHVISSGLRARRQGWVHLAVLAASLALLPIAPSEHWKPLHGGPPAGQIILLLLAAVGAPYFVLSSTGPLLQHWFSRSFPGRSPYRLYALSNFGSLLALVSYPFVVEPALRLRLQESLWSWAYAAYVALAAWCAIAAMRQKEAPIASSSDPSDPSGLSNNLEPAHPSLGRMILWVALAATGSAFLLATTNQLCQNVAVMPFLWVVPLSLYLLTFVICFDNPQWYDRRVFGLLLLIAAPLACWALKRGVETTLPLQVSVYSVVMFACCMTCHGELVLSRPHPRYLTLFYLLVSAGGVLGGLFVALAAPVLFSGFWEYHVTLGAACLLTLIAWCVNRAWQGRFPMVFWIWVVASAAQCGLAVALILGPYAARFTPLGFVILCVVCVAIQLLGWIWTAAWEDRPRALAWLWNGVSVGQILWIAAFTQWRCPGALPFARYGLLVLGAAVATVASIVLSDQSRRWWSQVWRQRILIGGVQILTLAGLAAMLVKIVDVEIAPGALGNYGSVTDAWSLLRAYIALLADSLVRHNGNAGFAYAWFLVAYAALLAGSVFRSKTAKTAYAEQGVWLWFSGSLGLALLLATLGVLARTEAEKPVYTARNFYGALRVTREDDMLGKKYVLTHGNIEHGLQYLSEDMRHEPTTYYGPETGVGLAIRFHPNRTDGAGAARPLRVGVVGLGAGAIAAYGKPGDYYRFYEINPEVLALSSEDKYFTYLNDSPAQTDVALGDARISMERELAEGHPQKFDVLAIDAFNGDAIPVHLLTLECAQVYLRHLKPGGLLLFHITNRYFNLGPVTRALGERLGLEAIHIDTDEDESCGLYATSWVILTADEEFASLPEIQEAALPWGDDDPPPLLWTDDFAGLWQVIAR